MHEELLDELKLSDAQPITDRRGQAVYLVKRESGEKAILKLSSKDSQDPRAPYPLDKLIENEAYIASKLPDSYGEYYLSKGQREDCTWVLLSYLEGETSTQVAQRAREAGDMRALFGLFKQMTRSLANLHQAKLIHADVQPSHFLIDDKSCLLIDFGLSSLGKLPFPYRGALVHYNAPEIARQLMESGEAEASFATDVYSLGASFCYLYAERTACQYRAEANYDDKLRVVAEGATITFDDLEKRDERIEGFIKGLISADPAQRLSAFATFCKDEQ